VGLAARYPLAWGSWSPTLARETTRKDGAPILYRRVRGGLSANSAVAPASRPAVAWVFRPTLCPSGALNIHWIQKNSMRNPASDWRGRGRPRYSRPGGRRYFSLLREVGATFLLSGRAFQVLKFEESGAPLLCFAQECRRRGARGPPGSYELVAPASWPAVVRASQPALQTQAQFFNPALAGFSTMYLMARSRSSPLRSRRS